MLRDREFRITRRRVGFDAGSGPPDLTAMVMSLAIRANCFAIRFHRANIVCFLTSNMRPMGVNGALFFIWLKSPEVISADSASWAAGKKRGFCRLRVARKCAQSGAPGGDFG